MKNFLSAIFTFSAAICIFDQASAQQYTPIDQGSSITFKIRNFGFTVDGTVSGLQGTIKFDPSNLANAYFDVSVDATTINTGNEMRDGHLKKEDYFDVAHYTRIHFLSTGVTAAKGGGFIL